MNNFKRIIAILLTTILLLSSAINVFAENVNNSPQATINESIELISPLNMDNVISAINTINSLVSKQISSFEQTYTSDDESIIEPPSNEEEIPGEMVMLDPEAPADEQPIDEEIIPEEIPIILAPSAFTGGDGTVGNPYLISTKDDLNAVRNNLTAHYQLTNDIVFTTADFASGGAYYNAGAGWTPIGNSVNRFTGSFDGGGFVIKHLTINIDSASIAVYAGLFGFSKGCIKNLGMIDSSISVSGSSSTSVGGIVGHLYNEGSIIDCFNTGNISSVSTDYNSYAGGIVGFISNKASIVNCYNMGNIYAAGSTSYSSSYAGGIAGYVNIGTIINCFNISNISASGYSYAYGPGGNPVVFTGGISGYISSGSITNCYSTGNVSSAGYTSDAGAISGYSSGTISNCYYLNTMIKGVGIGISMGTVSLSLEQMKNSQYFVGFDFGTKWQIKEEFNYPLPQLIAVPYTYTYISNTTNYDSGDGSVFNPYIIKTTAHLNNVRNNLGAYYILANDIAFAPADFESGGTYNNSGAGFVPIGNSTSSFFGVFDGNGFVIRNLKTSIDGTGNNYVGLFGYCTGSVKNLGLVDNLVLLTTEISDDDNKSLYVGGIVGFLSNAGILTNCYISGSVSSVISGFSEGSVFGYLGGVVGYAKGTIKNCYNTGNISSKSSISESSHVIVGGIVGKIFGNQALVSNCYNTGEISTDVNSVGFSGEGGIVGYSEDLSVVTQSYNTGNISSTISGFSEDYQPDIYIGGIIGFDYGVELKNCYNTGNISVLILGFSENYALNINAGGIMGCINIGTVTNCYNTGTISSLDLNAIYSGGIIGKSEGNRALISNCFYLNSIIKGVGVGEASGTLSLSSEQMKDRQFFVGFDFANIWKIDENSDYQLPQLRMLPMVSDFIENDIDYEGGDGSSLKPYRIKTKEHFNNIRKNLGSHFILTDDIIFTLSDFETSGNYFNGGKGFIPIGDEINKFYGNFDGCDFVIKNIQININTAETSYVGVFGYNSGVIKNFGVVDSVITISNFFSYDDISLFAGGIVGYNSYGILSNCYNTGKISTTSSASEILIGGITGFNSNGVLSNCFNKGNVLWSGSFYPNIGGIVGGNTGIITQCNNVGNISALSSEAFSFPAAGGISGASYSGASIVDCYNEGEISSSVTGGITGFNSFATITNCYNKGDIFASISGSSEDFELYAYAGGITGYNGFGMITNCYNKGDIFASISGSSEDFELYAYAGGIVGRARDGLITNCYNTGDICASSSSSVSCTYAGGISGELQQNESEATISLCYNTGIITATGAVSYKNGVSGHSSSGNIIDCYYLNTTIEGVRYRTAIGGVPLTSEQMKESHNYVGFDFELFWEILPGHYLPTLRANADRTVNLSTFTITGIIDKTYTGLSIAQDLTVKDDTITLVKDVDYTVYYTNNLNVGTASITITGIGNYTGEIVRTFNINPKYITSSYSIAGIIDKTYTGVALTQDFTVKDGSIILVKDVDYELVYINNLYPGLAYVNINGIGNYTGTIVKTFTIAESTYNISTFAVSGIIDKPYTGSNITQTLTVKSDAKTLTLGVDYTVDYTNNLNVGTASITITGIGNYTGEIVRTFNINPKYLDSTFVINGIVDKIYTGSVITQGLSIVNWGITLIDKVDYEIIYINNLYPGTTYILINGIGNYTGTIVKNFTINNPVVAIPTLKLTAGSKKITLSWSKITNASGYELYRATSLGGSYSLIKTITSGSTLKYVNTKRIKGKRYYYQIRAYRIINGVKVYSEFSFIKNVKAK